MFEWKSRKDSTMISLIQADLSEKQQPIYRRRFHQKRLFVYFSTAIIVLTLLLAAICLIKIRTGNKNRTPRGAIVTNGYTCAQIGANILEKGGSAVDAAIASLFCEGVSMPQSMGLGGGFIMTIYIKETGKAVVLNARETAPAAATETMFNGDIRRSTKGGLAIAVPGELRGYWEAYQKYGGKVPWKDLVKPTIDLCRNGILQTQYLARNHRSQIDQLRRNPELSETFIDPQTNSTYLEGQLVKRPRLARTLELISEFGADVLYNGNLTKGFVQDIRSNGGIITEADIKNYQPEWQTAVKIDMPFNQVLYSAPLPGAGVLLDFIFNVLKGSLDYSQPLSVDNWQKIIETFKYAFAKRTELGDLKFDNRELNIKAIIDGLTSTSYVEYVRDRLYTNQTFQDPGHYGAKISHSEDHGTAHICVVAPNGDAVAVTSTINLFFGAGIMSNSTGIILNDEMDDFASPNITSSFFLPPSAANFIKPGKKPLSSMSPTIIVEKDGGDVMLVIGAAGGTKITTSVALITIRNLWFNVSIQVAVDDKRLHHQLFPMSISFEEEYDPKFVAALHHIGHQYTVANGSTGFSAVTAIGRKNGILETATDRRRTGHVAYVY